MTRPRPVSDRMSHPTLRHALAGGLGLAVAIVVVPEALRSPEPLRGGVGVQIVDDLDGDGLADADELLLNTDLYLADTDGDGFSDPEELARHSDPLLPASTPTGTGPSTGLDATAHGGLLHLIQTHYLPNGGLIGADVALGMYLGKKLTFLSPLAWAANSSMSVLVGSEPGSSVLIVETKIRTRLVQTAGFVPFVATLRMNGSIVAADVVDIESLGGVLVRRVQVVTGPTPALASDGSKVQGLTNGQSSGAGQFGTTTIYQHIGEGGIGNNWIPGETCVQQMDNVGSSGAVLKQEVTSASCKTGWDGACSPSDCEATAGGTRETIDPGLLAGGG